MVNICQSGYWERWRATAALKECRSRDAEAGIDVKADRAASEEEAHVLLFERATTLNMGCVQNERTVAHLDRIRRGIRWRNVAKQLSCSSAPATISAADSQKSSSTRWPARWVYPGRRR